MLAAYEELVELRAMRGVLAPEASAADAAVALSDKLDGQQCSELRKLERRAMRGGMSDKVRGQSCGKA